MDIYFASVGHNGLMLLNVPPDTRGLIPAEDSIRLIEFRKERERIFSHDLSAGAEIEAEHLRGKKYNPKNLLDSYSDKYWVAKTNIAKVELKFDKQTTFDIVLLQEYIRLGQRVEHFSIHYLAEDGSWKSIPTKEACTTIGHKRLVRLSAPVTTTKLRFIFEAPVPPILSRLAIFSHVYNR